MHGASMVVLHSTSLSSIRLVQQADCNGVGAGRHVTNSTFNTHQVQR